MLRTQPYPEKDRITQLRGGEEEENIVGMKRQVNDRKVVKKKKKRKEIKQELQHSFRCDKS